MPYICMSFPNAKSDSYITHQTSIQFQSCHLPKIIVCIFLTNVIIV